MKEFLTSALAVFTYLPCKLMNCVDQHPSGSQIRTHIARQEVHVTETDEGVAAHLCLAGANQLIVTTAPEAGVGIKIDKDARDMRTGYTLGVKDGVRLMAAEAVSVTRTTIRAQTKMLREVADAQAAEEALEARSLVGMPPFTAVSAV